MIKAVYTYSCLTEDLPELMGKFAQSADKKFDSIPTNTKIEMSQKVEADQTITRLDIYYQNLRDFEQRQAFEVAHPDWQQIWFNQNNKHTLLSLEVFEILM